MQPDDDRDPIVEAYKAGIDMSLIRGNPKRSVEEMIRKTMTLQRLVSFSKRATDELRSRC